MNRKEKVSDLEIIDYFKECNECKREFLISVALIGINHNAAINVVCKECLRKKGVIDEFKKQNPESAIEIEKWLGNGERK